MKGFLGFGKNHNQPVNNIHFEICGCKSEILVLEYDYEIGLMDLAIYEHGISFRNKMNWFQKLRYIWQVIRYNKPFNDQIVLDKTQIQKLKQYLDRCI
jgi:tRNA(Ile2) C34 agmatinyltransferase TiaS